MEHVDDHHAPCKKQLQGVPSLFVRANGHKTSWDHNACKSKAVKCLTRPGAGVGVSGRGLGDEPKLARNHKFGPAAARSNSWQPEIDSARASTCSLRSPAAPGPFARRKHRQVGRPRTPKSRPQRVHPTSYPAVGCTRRGGGTPCPPYARGLPRVILLLTRAAASPQPSQGAAPR